MRVGAIIQARTSSARLPGKVLRPLDGRPALAYTIDSVGHSAAIDALAVATSADPSDDALADFCAAAGVRCERGDLHDVAGRLAAAAAALGLDAFVRVNGDSPFIDPRLIDRAVALLEDERPDLVTNVFPRSFPRGQSVEVIELGALERARTAMRSREEREHVTPYLYAHPDEFRIHNFSADEAADWVPLTLDTEADHRRLEAIAGRMRRPHWEYDWRAVERLAEEVER